MLGKMCDNINADRWAEYVKDAEVCYETDCTSSGSVIRAGMLKCILSSDHSACIVAERVNPVGTHISVLPRL